MDPAISKVFEAEEKARTIVEKAKEQASSIRNDASAKAEKILSEAKEQSALETKNMIQRANAEIRERIEREINAAKEEGNGKIAAYQTQIKKAASLAAEILVRSELDGTKG